MFVVPAIDGVSTGRNQMGVRRSAVDIRPFLSKAALERRQQGQDEMATRFRSLGNPNLIAVIGQIKAPQSENDVR